ncbi:hypothetical protein D9Q98_003039 [Chlorella vulgaris]|uniref:Uncharacterized protein n=1 Tax=Chlorella vulgaris TaxID=3077 RepID=A0A9D4TUI9_CHLVU|nr:hypothetical protein D9Q98_003039 [Chlorella vulgaris]
MKVKGANFFPVHTAGEFKQRLEGGFIFLSGPSGTSNAGNAGVGGWRVLHVYGSPDSEERRLSGGGSIMRVNTLFSAAKSEDGIKGGAILLRMRPPPGTTLQTASPLRLSARYITGLNSSTRR